MTRKEYTMLYTAGSFAAALFKEGAGYNFRADKYVQEIIFSEFKTIFSLPSLHFYFFMVKYISLNTFENRACR